MLSHLYPLTASVLKCVTLLKKLFWFSPFEHAILKTHIHGAHVKPLWTDLWLIGKTEYVNSGPVDMETDLGPLDSFFFSILPLHSPGVVFWVPCNCIF